MSNRPRGREKHIEGTASVHKRGEGLNTGPVGRRKTTAAPSSGKRSGGSPGLLVILLAMLLGGGGTAVSGMLGGQGDAVAPNNNQTPPTQETSQQHTFTVPVTQSQPSVDTTTAELNTAAVSSGTRDKYTQIIGNGKDQTTVMIYMCGTDLESRSGMATSDMSEIAKASSSDQVNFIIYTGGCQRWKINGISNTTNQIYQIKDGNLYRLEESMGSKPMVEPSTLTEFINYCKKNFPANRYDLIMWDHGAGSITGYGHDELYSRRGSMSLSMLDQALTSAGVKFDFVGFDACLMATAENALMLSEHADYLIASEETEPGIGWYYTDWVNQYVKNPSMKTVDLAKVIIDSFVEECSYKVNGQSATLSVIDLAEFENIIPEKLKNWSKATSEMIQNNDYKTIAKARQNTKEFNQNRIDQCDFIDLLTKMDTKESKDLAKALKTTIKYNRTSRSMSNAYGVSIYFPNRNPRNVAAAAQINEAIGIDDEFIDCMKDYASLSTAGQSVSYGNGNTGNPYASLFGNYAGSTSTEDQTAEILQQLFYAGLNAMFTPRNGERSLSPEMTAEFITNNQFNSANLRWVDFNETKAITLSEDQWSLVTELEENMFVDDGEGYIDLGYDNVFDIDEYGNLLAPEEKTWLAINGQVIAYYHSSTVDFGDDNYTIQGYVPAYLNGERVDLILTFDNNNPRGYITGYIMNYEGETEAVAKVDQLMVGDVLEFVCDYYDYNGNYSNSYYLGEPMTVSQDMRVSDVVLENEAVITYKFTDIYHQEYWSESLR